MLAVGKFNSHTESQCQVARGGKQVTHSFNQLVKLAAVHHTFAERRFRRDWRRRLFPETRGFGFGLRPGRFRQTDLNSRSFVWLTRPRRSTRDHPDEPGVHRASDRGLHQLPRQ